MVSTDLSPKEYHSYYSSYIDILGTTPLEEALHEGLSDLSKVVAVLSEDKLTYAYAADKWTIAEVLVHVIDAERVFQYRALRFARNDKADLVGFEQDEYVPESRANQRTKAEIFSEFEAVRASTISLFKSFDVEQMARVGVANASPMSVRALGFVICGHLAHHLRVLRERYGVDDLP